MNYLKQYIGYISLIACLFTGPAFATGMGDLYQVQDLSGKWKFTIGDQEAWAKPYYDDQDWEMIHVPGTWEDQGFNGYNGYAWYRKSFYTDIPAQADLFLVLGYIDDVDEVYLNGKLIGFSGNFPPAYQTAYKAFRVYPISKALLNEDGKNTIAVRVYDCLISGGIIAGDVGIYAKKVEMPLEVNLAGPWSFRLGDDAPWDDDDADLQDWDRMMVPGYWEHAGYEDYDGYAWYQKQFKLNPAQASRDMILMLGRIDDVDQVFINGRLIGSTGMDENGGILNEGDSESWRKIRAYRIPAYSLDPREEYIIQVRVYDWTGDGGIYEGRIGLVPHSIFKQYFKG